jgi:hypothetical protein
MISIPSISQTTLSSLTAISPLSLQGVSARTDGISAAMQGSASTIVQLSATGQVLSADSLLKSSLQSLQASSSAATPGSVVASTQNFVATFNQTQISIGNALPLLGSQFGSTLIKQLSQTLNAAATAYSTSAGSADQLNLQTIGITAQTSVVPSSAQTTVMLRIDPAVLTAAASANPASTQRLLTRATQPLLQQVASFEAVATRTAGLVDDVLTQGLGIPVDLLKNLPTDTLANAVQLSDIDLAAVGLDASTLQSSRAALDAALSATLTATTNARAATNTAQVQPSEGAATQAKPDATAQAVAVPANAAASPTTTFVLAAPTLATPSATSIATTATAPAASDQASPASPASTQAGEARFSDEALRTLNNNAFNPFYSAIVASYHASDGATPRPASQPLNDPSIPEPVSAARRVRAIKG